PTQEYLAYIPKAGADNARVLVSVHGISRNANEQATVFWPYCERFGVVLVAPLFTPDYHKDYQRLGRDGRGLRADFMLDRCVEEVARLSGADATQTHIFGYSGGAQFAHRYLMAHPHRVRRAVIAASGWYTMPDHRRRFPYGIRSTSRLPGVSFNPEEFLQVPIEVLVGSDDTDDVHLKHTARLDKQQGKNRVERARTWSEAMREASVLYGISPRVSFTEVPETDHSFATFCRRGALVKRVFKHLFDESIGPNQRAVKISQNGNLATAGRLFKKGTREAEIGSSQRNKS
ncbi:MAG: alpha/beta fold hydrolase, partial [Gammaproteobacteria bacterium]